LTFYDPETGVFGALGHSVNDIETGVIIPLPRRTIMHSVVTDVIIGKAGMPDSCAVPSASIISSQADRQLLKRHFGTLDSNDMIRGKKALLSRKLLKSGRAGNDPLERLRLRGQRIQR
jgi:stage IV sporulation protein B